MSKGFMWVCQNNDKTDYVELSIHLAQSIKKYNRQNTICVLTDSQTKINSPHIDVVKTMQSDDSKDHKIKWANEHKVFSQSPFKHTIKLAADMLWTTNTDWWWNYLWQHDMVFALDCYNYKNVITKDSHYRPFHKRNRLPNIYSDLTYFRRSRKVIAFGKIVEALSKNWKEVRDSFLVNCHDEYPSTDVVYALAHRIVDPTQQTLIDYPWFKFIHNKTHIHGLDHIYDVRSYLMPFSNQKNIKLGSYNLTRPWHYVHKDMLEEINGRIF
jgi:hypothetical protein